MQENNNINSIGIGTILFLIFLVLKLGGWGIVATWSWWWIFSPLYIPILIILFLYIIFLLFVFIIYIIFFINSLK